MKEQTFKNKWINDNGGFTLIEIAIGMLILGLILTPFLTWHNIQNKQTKINETQEAFRHVENALKSYVDENDIFPMPASLIESEADAAYGQSIDNTVFPNICPDLSAGVCASGDGAPTFLGDNDVVIGFVPFATLQIEEDYAYDSWGNKLIYAVTVKQAVNNGAYTFQRLGPGGVQLWALDNAGNPVSLNTPAADYSDFQAIIVSTGPTGKGGFNADGNLMQTCIEVGNPEYEDENCSFTINNTSSNRFLIDENRGSDSAINTEDNGTRSLQAGPTFYDDYTYEIREINGEVWDKKDDATDPALIADVVSAASRLGIGEQQPETAMHLRGDLLATDDPLTTTVTEGKVQATILSDNTGDFQMDPNSLVGSDPNMNCHARIGSALLPVLGIGNNRVFCASPIEGTGTSPLLIQFEYDTSEFPGFQFDTTGITTLDCPSGELMIGIDATGATICQPRP